MESMQFNENNEPEILNENSVQEVSSFKYHPKNRSELIEIIEVEIKDHGPNCDLNNIDVSQITNMSKIFSSSKFNGDISGWDVSNVTDMSYMFYGSKFNGNITNWDVSNVTDMYCMFWESKFNGNIINWDMSKVTDMRNMFGHSPLEKVYGSTPKLVTQLKRIC